MDSQALNIQMNEINPQIPQLEENKDTLVVPLPKTKHMILDTAYFIKLKPLNLLEGFKYYTTQFVVNEIRDQNARNFFDLNKEFIIILNPQKDSLKVVTSFAKLSKDLSCLSLPDLSIIGLAYELIKSLGHSEFLRKEPLNYEIVQKELKKKSTEQANENEIQAENEDEGEWITSENIDKKLKHKTEISYDEKPDEKISVFIHTADFTIQNVSLKMGIPVLGIDGYRIRKIKNYILKCTTCLNFIFDTSKKFCEFCGYPALMKVGCSVNANGELKINDKKAEPRKRGCQFDLPKPSLSKRGVVYILSEDQLPKKRNEFDMEKNLDKILDNYDKMKQIPLIPSTGYENNSSKKFKWGYPRNNPNKPKKYYSKK